MGFFFRFFLNERFFLSPPKRVEKNRIKKNPNLFVEKITNFV